MLTNHHRLLMREHEDAAHYYLDSIIRLKERLASLLCRNNPCKGVLYLITACKLELQEAQRSAAYHLVVGGYSVIAAGKRLGLEWNEVTELVAARDKAIQKIQKAERQEQEQKNG